VSAPVPDTGRAQQPVWLVHLSSRRPSTDTIARLEAAPVARSCALTPVVAPDDSSVPLLEASALPQGELPEVGLRHADAIAQGLRGVLADAPGTVVLAAVDRVAHLAAWQLLADHDRLVAANTLDAAVRVVELLRAGSDLERVLHPPAFDVRLSVAEAGVGPAADGQTEVRVDRPADAAGDPADASGADWISFAGNDLDVRSEGMGRQAARAVRAAAGTRRRVADAADRRLVLGPANYAGQGFEWARAVREHAPGWSARNVVVTPTRAALTFPADLPLVADEWAQPMARIELAVELLADATDVVVEAMRPLLAVRHPGVDVNAWDPALGRQDVRALESTGRRVSLLFHGSEARRPDVHAELTPWSPFGSSGNEALTANLVRATRAVHEALEDFAGTRFVSTPDLLDHVPDARWLPVVVGPSSFEPARPPFDGRRPVVAHAPSSSALKGSQWVDPVLQRMHDDGLLTYLRLRDLPPIMVPSVLREVDVVIDQVVLGNPGVLAAQAMAAGRLVVAHLPQQVRRRFADPVPVVEATPATVEQVMLAVLENNDHYREVAARGVAFARKYHDGRMSAQVITEALSS
jgi:hypothetical protein